MLLNDLGLNFLKLNLVSLGSSFMLPGPSFMLHDPSSLLHVPGVKKLL